MQKNAITNLCKVTLSILTGFIVFSVVIFLCFISNWPVDSANKFQLVELATSYGMVLLIIGLIIGAGVFLVYWVVFRFLLKNKKVVVPLAVSISVALSIILIPLSFSVVAWQIDKKQIVPLIMEISGLPDIPKSAYDIKYGKGGNLFARKSYLKFCDSKESIEAYIDGSDILKGLEIQEIDIKEEDYTPYKSYGNFTWFNPYEVLKGRKFSYENDDWNIIITIDDDHNIVYVEIYSS
ncbi:MAG TPA: hypothetical protein PK033_11750 [Acetivibrio sp.]|nr:hypothetical protein [Clostridium sp.]HQA58537.1 hypothetical protein [Acetivibrio sp.]